MIDRSVEELWEYLADLEGHQEWMADIASMEFEGASRRGVGTRMVVGTRVGPFRTNDVLEVVDWDEGKSISVAHRGVIRGQGELSVEPEGNGSRVTWAEELMFPWWLGGNVAAFVARPFLRRVWRRNLKRLAALVSP